MHFCQQGWHIGAQNADNLGSCAAENRIQTADSMAYTLRDQRGSPVAKGLPMPAHLHRSMSVRRLLAGAVAVMLAAIPAAAQDTLKLGLVAAMSGQSAKSGE